MAQDIQQAKDDIAYIKGFLRDSGRAPLVIGHFYLLTGVAVTLTALREYALEVGWGLPGFLVDYMPWDMVAVMLFGFAASSIIMWRRGHEAAGAFRPQDLNAGARAANHAWGAVSFAVLIGALCLWISGMEDWPIAAVILFAVCWSIGWSVTYTVHRVGWHRLVVLGFIIFAVAIAGTAGHASMLLVMALGWLSLFAVPGWRIIVEANRADAARKTEARS